MVGHLGELSPIHFGDGRIIHIFLTKYAFISELASKFASISELASITFNFALGHGTRAGGRGARAHFGPGLGLGPHMGSHIGSHMGSHMGSIWDPI